MKRKIKITAPDDPTFRIQGTEMFCRIQPGHTWQCKKHYCRYCFSYPPKKLFLILINFNQWKNFLFCTVISDVFRTVLSLPVPDQSIWQYNTRHPSSSIRCTPICYPHYKKVINFFNNSVTKRQKMTRIVNLWYCFVIYL